jgi:hypothetical protein
LLTALKTILFTLNNIRKFGIPTHIISFGHSLGDNLLLTTLAAELYGRGYKNVWIKCDHNYLFDNNPHIKLVLPFNALLSTSILRIFKAQLVHPVYTKYHSETDRDEIPEKHIILKMADCLELTGSIKNKPAIFLTHQEAEQGAYHKKQIAITCSTSGAIVPMSTKEWIPERYQQVVDLLYKEYDFIQLGTRNDPPLKNVTDLRGKLTIRESAAVLKKSLLVITHVGFMMHLARAVDCRAVVIYGGRETPGQSGYSCFKNIYSNVACSPCWLHNACPFEKQCMAMITAEHVKDAVIQQVQLYGQALNTDVLLND